MPYSMRLPTAVFSILPRCAVIIAKWESGGSFLFTYNAPTNQRLRGGPARHTSTAWAGPTPVATTLPLAKFSPNWREAGSFAS
eukprot:8860390-Lingulodinium_polyedra.AAC.1